MNRATLTTPVAESSLGTISERGVVVPTYDRSALVPRIVHIGVGGFHRAHMALYTDDVAATGSDWGICGLGLLPGDARMADALRPQDHLYTLTERASDSSTTRVSDTSENDSTRLVSLKIRRKRRSVSNAVFVFVVFVALRWRIGKT